MKNTSHLIPSFEGPVDALDEPVLFALSSLLELYGGVQGIVKHLEARRDLIDVVRSWLAPGEKQPISSTQVYQSLGSGTLEHLAVKFGISVPLLAEEIARLLPQVVERLNVQ